MSFNKTLLTESFNRTLLIYSCTTRKHGKIKKNLYVKKAIIYMLSVCELVKTWKYFYMFPSGKIFTEFMLEEKIHIDAI